MDFSSMNQTTKLLIKAKFALCIQRIIAANKIQAKRNKENGVKDHKLINSLRKLAASSEVEYSIIQKIASGQKNPELTTIVCIADGLGMSETELFAHYSIVSDADASEFVSIARKSSTKKQPILKKKK